MTRNERLKDDLSQCGVTHHQQEERRLTVRCSAHLCRSRASCLLMSFVLVYFCVTVVIHIGHEEVLVIYVAIFVVIFCNWRCTLYTSTMSSSCLLFDSHSKPSGLHLIVLPKCFPSVTSPPYAVGPIRGRIFVSKMCRQHSIDFIQRCRRTT